MSNLWTLILFFFTGVLIVGSIMLLVTLIFFRKEMKETWREIRKGPN